MPSLLGETATGRKKGDVRMAVLQRRKHSGSQNNEHLFTLVCGSDYGYKEKRHGDQVCVCKEGGGGIQFIC